MYVPLAIPEELFAGAELYRQQIKCDRISETSRSFPYTERHLQAVWFDARFRPKPLKTSRGEPLVVENPGRWNLEAGPDFLGAVLLIGREQRRVAGDVEVHIHPSDWKQHGHAGDPRYDNVRFHVCWFSGQVDASLFPAGTVQISCSEACAADLDRIDPAAYPYAEPRAAAKFPLAGKPPEDIIRILESAGEERLRQKTLRMAWLMKQRGASQALYEEVAAALGYKHNKTPFRTLAQRLPLDALAQYGNDWKTVYSVLLGISGLLPRQPGTNWPNDSKAELRSLWDSWWREEHRWEDVAPLDKSDWRLAGVRPLNHPVRRLCALAQYVASGFFTSDNINVQRLVPQCRCFWSRRLGWTGKEKEAELVGKGRLLAMDLNVLVPYRLANGERIAFDGLPVEPMNSVIRETAYTLLGPDHSPKLYRTALARQGLIQIFHDFILTGRIEDFCRQI